MDEDNVEVEMMLARKRQKESLACGSGKVHHSLWRQTDRWAERDMD